MNTLDVIFSRKSTREYKPDLITEEALEIILKAGMAAPVASGKYDSLHLTVVQNEDILKDLFERTTEYVHKLGLEMNMDFGARTLIIVSSVAGPNPGAGNANAAFILENMVLAATDLGIDSVVMGIVPAVIKANDDLPEKLGIPEGYVPGLSAVFGYGVEEEHAKEHHITVNRV